MEKATPEMILSASVRFATKMSSCGVLRSSLDEFMKNGNDPLWKAIEERFTPTAVQGSPPFTGRYLEPQQLCKEWSEFYKKFFSLSIDLSTVQVPQGLERTEFIAEGITINMAVQAHTDRDIPFWKYCNGDIESVMRESERGPVKASYAIRVRKGQEADSDLRNLSAEDITAKGIDTENLLERLIHGLKYFDETGKHLDVKNITLCASSRYADGYVPCVDRIDDGAVYVRWCHPQGRNSYLGARRAVR